MTLRQFQVFAIFFFASGMLWLIWNYFYGISITPCILKNVTGMPCPGCGSTRAAILALGLKFREAASLNPLGLFYACAIVVLPTWLVYDFYFRSDTMFNTWNKFEQLCKRKSVLMILILLIVSLWVHNIVSGL